MKLKDGKVVKMKKRMNFCNILGLNVAVTNMDKTLSYIEENLDKLRGKYICITNVHTTVMAYEDDNYKKIQNNSALILPDGNPLSSLSRKKGFKEAERVTGPDLMHEIFKISEEKGYRHYFYGSTEDTLSELNIKLKEKYPKLNISAMYSPPFKSNVSLESEDKIKEINSSDPDFIWIGLGAPKQEIWMNLHKDKLNGVMIGVGAGFDYLADKIKRAPEWMQKSSLEWFYRLMQEPRRLFKRYLTTNVKFIYLTKILKL